MWLQMLKKLSKQLNGEDFTWNNLNTLCWAIGSISGSMAEDQVYQNSSVFFFCAVMLVYVLHLFVVF